MHNLVIQLGQLPCLERMYLHSPPLIRARAVTPLKPISWQEDGTQNPFPAMKDLTIRISEAPGLIALLSVLPNLRQVEIGRPFDRRLSIDDAEKVVEALARLPLLETIKLGDLVAGDLMGLPAFSPLQKCRNLKSLTLETAIKFGPVDGLSRFVQPWKHLSVLRLGGQPRADRLSTEHLLKLTALETVSEACPSLEELFVAVDASRSVIPPGMPPRLSEASPPRCTIQRVEFSPSRIDDPVAVIDYLAYLFGGNTKDPVFRLHGGPTTADGQDGMWHEVGDQLPKLLRTVREEKDAANTDYNTLLEGYAKMEINA